METDAFVDAPLSHSPIAAVLTPAARGAVAVVRVVGSGATAACEQYFQAASGRKLAEFETGRIVFGRWIAEGRGTTNGAGEELVVCRRAADDVEIHCHGGTAATSAVCESLASAGCRIVSAMELLRSLEGDAIVVEAAEALTKASTSRAASILLDQYSGALRREVDQLRLLLANGAMEAAMRRIDVLLAHSTVGLRLTEPYRVVLAGPPNVGKSSLLNALVGHDRALVFDQPGTTRDVVTSHAVFDGVAVELSDTAGVRESTDALEASGIQAAAARKREADLIVLVFDRSAAWTTAEVALLNAHPQAIVVFNKADRPPCEKCDATAQPRPDGLPVSALTGMGREQLMHAVVRRLVPVTIPASAAVPFTLRQVRLLGDSGDAIRKGDADQAVKALGQL
ncbi:MAG: hypothetical protein C0483_06025 [Pirellula sp.]|nr:hypothetical protein [Pirellula sp.]